LRCSGTILAMGDTIDRVLSILKLGTHWCDI